MQDSGFASVWEGRKTLEGNRERCVGFDGWRWADGSVEAL